MTYTNLPPVGDYGVLLTSGLLKTLLENNNHFRTPPQHIYTRDPGEANYAISSTVFVDLDATNMKPQLNFTGNPVQVELYAGRVTVTTGPLYLTLTVDGNDIGGGVNNGLAYVSTSITNSPLTFRWVITGLDAGLHTIGLRVRVAAGSASITTINGVQFTVREM